ncbi:hypothetical protein Z950_3318 [Sulfitobacter mediterraneus KCTC 32188]|nr:hypothetical protein Z950_3318 [Sulfitobacter mediterraneus KCTC 32188]
MIVVSNVAAAIKTIHFRNVFSFNPYHLLAPQRFAAGAA